MNGWLTARPLLWLVASLLLAAALTLPLLSGALPPSLAQAATPTVTLSPASGPAGTSVKATGRGWVAGSRIKLSFDNTPLAPFTAQAAEWTHTFTIPSSVPQGIHEVFFTERTATTACALGIAFTVT